MQTFLSGCRNPGDRDSGETAFRACGWSAPVPGARRARSVTTIRAPALQARAEAWPQRPIVRACPGGTCSRGPPPTPTPTSAIATAATRYLGSPVATEARAAGAPSVALCLSNKFSLSILVGSTLLKTATCAAGNATRPPCPALPCSRLPRGPRPTQARSCRIFFRAFYNLTRVPAHRSALHTDHQPTVLCAILLCITDLPLKMSRAATLVWSVVKVEGVSPGAR